MLIGLASLLLGLPTILDGLPTGGDSRFHVRWVDGFTRELWDGTILPRWLNDGLLGYGSPVFYFYPPLGYVTAAGLGPPDALGADLRLIILTIALRALAGLASYLWLARAAPAGTALAGALLYVSAPYPLIVDSYLRGAYAELWGFVWLPLMLHAVERIRARSQAGFAELALAWAGLLLSHLPSAIVAASVPFVYALVRQGWQPGSLVKLLAAMVLGLLLAAFALLPALALLDEVGRAALLTAQRPWADGFVGIGLLRDEPAKAGVTLLNLGMLTVAIVAIGTARSRFDLGGRDRWLLATGAIALVAAFMTIPLSAPLWHLLPPLPYVQFPWRFNLVLSLALAGLMPAVLLRLARIRRLDRLLRLALWAGVVAGLAIDAFGLYKYWPDGERGAARVAEARRAIEVPQHLPLEWVPRTASGGVDLLLADRGPKRPIVIEGEARVLGWSSGGRPFRVDVATEARIVVPRLHFTGVEVRADGRAIEHVAAWGPLGLVCFTLPPGRHELTIEQRMLPVEWTGLVISVLGLALLIAVSSSRSLAARAGLRAA